MPLKLRALHFVCHSRHFNFIIHSHTRTHTLLFALAGINCVPGGRGEGGCVRPFKSQSIDCLAAYAEFAFSTCKQIEKQLNYLNKNNRRCLHTAQVEEGDSYARMEGGGRGAQPHNQRAGAQHNENCELIMAPNPLTFPQSHCECKLEMDAMRAWTCWQLSELSCVGVFYWSSQQRNTRRKLNCVENCVIYICICIMCINLSII